jgi:hypothetical protein
MSEDRFRTILGRLDSGPHPGDDELGRRIWERIEPALLAEVQLEPVDDRTDASSREVVMLNKNTFVTPRRTWGIRVVIGIAAVAALAVAGIVLVSGDDEPSEVATIDNVDEEPIGDVVEPGPTTRDDAPGASEGSDVRSNWDALPVIELEEHGPGEFRTAKFFTPFGFSLPGGWVAILDEVDLVGFVPPDFDIDTGTVWFLDVGEPTLDATHARVTDLSDVEVTGPEPTTLGGAPGISYEVSVPTTQTLITFQEEHLGHFWVEEGRSYVFTNVDVAGAIVTVVIEGRPATFDALETEVQAFLDSVVWKEAVVPVAELDWTWSTTPGPAGIVRSAAVVDGSMVAVGYISTDEDDDDAVAWRLHDGAWQRSAVEDGDGPGLQWINSVTTGGPGLVAVGMEIGPNRDSDLWDAAVWLSEDGQNWERVEQRSFSESSFQEMWGVTSFDGRLVAVGFALDATADRQDLAVWVSHDGRNWQRTSVDSLTAPGYQGTGDAGDPSIAVGPSGLVAVGSDDPAATSEGFTGKAAVWVSVDGTHWEHVDSRALDNGAETLDAIAATTDLYVAIGVRNEGPARNVGVWVSPDGRSWSLADPDAFDMPGPQWAHAIAVHGDEIIVFGRHLGDPERDLAWFSSDGFDWEPIDLPAPASTQGVPMFALSDGDTISVLGLERPLLTASPQN